MWQKKVDYSSLLSLEFHLFSKADTCGACLYRVVCNFLCNMFLLLVLLIGIIGLVYERVVPDVVSTS